MPTAAVEAYLETIYNLAMEGEPVIAARLAEHFGVSRATVSEMVGRLVTGGYVALGASKHLTLTDVGRELTEQALRRHRLTERLLFEVLGMDWVSAHEQAHALEHWISAEVEERISALLGQPQTCPHGNPIPGNAPAAPEFLRSQGAFRLSQTEEGQSVRVVLISEVVEDESALLRALGEQGIRPEGHLTVLTNRAAEPVIFEAEGRRHSIDPALAGKVWVR